MSGSIVIHTAPDIELKDALLVVGAPGLGLVGAITTQYIVHHLKMRRIGSLHGSFLQPAAVVVEGRSAPPVRVFLSESAPTFGNGCERLVSVTFETVLEEDDMDAVADALVMWAREKECRLIVAPDGVTVEDDTPGERVWGAASSDGGIEFLRKENVDLFPSGVVGGLTGALLNAGERHGVDTITLLAETSPGYPDAHAAVRLVEVLDRGTPSTKIETAPLVEEAERIEAQVRSMRAEMEAKSKRGDGTSMFH